MVFMPWTKDMAMGIACVDADHRMLVNLINQTSDCVDQHEETITLGSVLNALIKYTGYHFSREEKLQELCAYPDLERHKLEHKNLIVDVLAIHQRYLQDPVGLAAAEVRDFLRQWLLNHILVDDFAFRDVCVGNKEAIAEAAAMTFMSDSDEVTGAVIDFSDLSVLLVDDNPNFSLLMKTIMKALGIRNIRQASSGEQALAMLAKKASMLVLCDWVMDGMNGAEFSRKLHQFDDTAKIILVTGHCVDKYRVAAKTAGVSEFLQKPISVHNLLDVIVKTIS